MESISVKAWEKTLFFQELVLIFFVIFSYLFHEVVIVKLTSCWYYEWNKGKQNILQVGGNLMRFDVYIPFNII